MEFSWCFNEVFIWCFDERQREVFDGWGMHGRIYLYLGRFSDTYDHRLKATGYPVRSAIHKLEIG